MALQKLNKQFFSYLATYLVGSWSLIQFVEWFCRRYDFDSSWTDLIGIGIVLLLPSAILFSWLHADESNQFKKQKLFYLGNLGLLLTALISLSQGFAGTTTQKLEITDEYGVKKEVEVSKKEYIRQIAFLPFQNDANEGWLSHAFPTLISTDINQCKRFNTYSSSYFVNELKRMDYETKEILPQNIKEKLTNDLADYIVSGSINALDELTYVYEIELFSQKMAKPLFSTKGTTNDLYAVTDSLSVVLAKEIFKKDLKIKFDTYKNIPTKELFTANPKALQAYFKADFEFDIDDYANARQNIEQAIEYDRKFAEAYKLRGLIHNYDGKIEEGRADFEQALQLSSSVSDYQQRRIKVHYYENLLDKVKQKDFLEMWIKIHPEDDLPFNDLMNLHLNNRSYEKAIAVGQAAEKAGHKSIFLIRLTSLYAQMNNKEKTEEYLKKYQKAFPDDDEIERKIGAIYFQQHEYEEALKHFETYNTLNPLEIRNNVDISYTLFNLGRYNQSIELLQGLPPKAKNYRDSTRIYYALENQYVRTGQVKKAIATMNERHDFSARHTQLLEKLQEKAQYSLELHYYIGDESLVESRFAEVEELSKEFIVYAKANYYITTENGVKLEELIQAESAFIQKGSSVDMFRLFEGLAHKFKGEYTEAMPIFEKKVAKEDDFSVEYFLYECYQQTGAYEKAIKGFEKLLKKYPYNGECLLSYAQCLNDNGQVEQAKTELEKLLKLWENADPEYIRYKEALAFSEQVNLLQ